MSKKVLVFGGIAIFFVLLSKFFWPALIVGCAFAYYLFRKQK